MNNEFYYVKLRGMVDRCKWTFAKTMPFAPHEYIVRDRCSLTKDEFEYLVKMQRERGVKERWGKYNNSYLYIDDYKYWTMGAPIEETTVINRAKACVVNDVGQLYDGINQGDATMSYVEKYIHKYLGLTDDNKGFNVELINGRMKEIDDCVTHLERIRNKYACDVMLEWSKRLSVDYSECKRLSLSSLKTLLTRVSPFLMKMFLMPSPSVFSLRMGNYIMVSPVCLRQEKKVQNCRMPWVLSTPMVTSLKAATGCTTNTRRLRMGMRI